jgi:hypothetical protein
MRLGKLYQRLYDRQSRRERDRFVNPGEGPEPEPAPERPRAAEPERPSLLPRRWGPSADDPP